MTHAMQEFLKSTLPALVDALAADAIERSTPADEPDPNDPCARWKLQRIAQYTYADMMTALNTPDKLRAEIALMRAHGLVGIHLSSPTYWDHIPLVGELDHAIGALQMAIMTEATTRAAPTVPYSGPTGPHGPGSVWGTFGVDDARDDDDVDVQAFTPASPGLRVDGRAVVAQELQDPRPPVDTADIAAETLCEWNDADTRDCLNTWMRAGIKRVAVSSGSPTGRRVDIVDLTNCGYPDSERALQRLRELAVAAASRGFGASGTAAPLAGALHVKAAEIRAMDAADLNVYLAQVRTRGARLLVVEDHTGAIIEPVDMHESDHVLLTELRRIAADKGDPAGHHSASVRSRQFGKAGGHPRTHAMIASEVAGMSMDALVSLLRSLAVGGYTHMQLTCPDGDAIVAANTADAAQVIHNVAVFMRENEHAPYSVNGMLVDQQDLDRAATRPTPTSWAERKAAERNAPPPAPAVMPPTQVTIAELRTAAGDLPATNLAAWINAKREAGVTLIAIVQEYTRGGVPHFSPVDILDLGPTGQPIERYVQLLTCILNERTDRVRDVA